MVMLAWARRAARESVFRDLDGLPRAAAALQPCPGLFSFRPAGTYGLALRANGRAGLACWNNLSQLFVRVFRSVGASEGWQMGGKSVWGGRVLYCVNIS